MGMGMGMRKSIGMSKSMSMSMSMRMNVRIIMSMSCFSNDQFRHDLQMATDASELYAIACQAFKTAAA